MTEPSISSAERRGREDARARIVAAAETLLAQGGRDALTTRAVAEVAGVQVPALYRLFGDKVGLLDAVAARGFERYFAEKADRAPGPDPVEDLRHGWNTHIGFGLANPGAYALMYGVPRPGGLSPAAQAGYRVLEGHVHRIALAGRLRVGEARAAQMIHAAGSGTVFALLAIHEDKRDLGLSDATREAVLAAIVTETPVPSGVPVAATALRAALPDVGGLTDRERALLGEWLDRITLP